MCTFLNLKIHCSYLYSQYTNKIIEFEEKRDLSQVSLKSLKCVQGTQGTKMNIMILSYHKVFDKPFKVNDKGISFQAVFTNGPAKVFGVILWLKQP